MAELDYASNSLSDISKDNIVNEVGTVIRNSNGSITLQDKSQCTFAYNFDTTSNKLSCEGIKLDYLVNTSSATRSTRYSVDVTIDVIIQFYKETFNESGVSQGYVADSYQFTRIMPAFLREDKGYLGTLEIESNIGLIKQISITLGFYDGNEEMSGDTVTFDYVNLYNSRTTQQVVSDTYGWSAVVRNITIKPNGYELGYDGVAEKTSLLIDIEDIEGTPTLTQIIVNSTKDSEVIITVDSNDIPIPRN